MNEPPTTWNFLSNYVHTLICLADDPEARMRDVAAPVGITERAATRIVSHLEHAGILTRHRVGRRNRYEIHKEQSLRHPLESHCSVGALLSLVLEKTELNNSA